MTKIRQAAVLGAGVIGASWTTLFVAAGVDVKIFDPSPDIEKNVNEYVENAWPTLVKLGLVEDCRKGNIRFFGSAAEAVQNVQFVQENLPEKLELKHRLFREIEPYLEKECVVASSASGLMVSEMQEGWGNPARFLLGHPFNPPHLIPLVELLGNEKTDEEALSIAESFYEQVGKVTIRINREVPGHVANRLQAALWREAIHLVHSGVASVEDVDKAVWAGPGLRWAAMGPHMLFHLGAGPGGMKEFCKRYTDSFNRWWEDLGDLQLSEDVAMKLVAGVANEARGEDVGQLSSERDALITQILSATNKLRS